MKIYCLNRNEIDDSVWNKKLIEAENKKVYALTNYLDAMCDNWCALISDNYEYIMPLPFRKKYLIPYVYTPEFVPQLGIFGNNISAQVVENFITHIPKKFKRITYNFNEGNFFDTIKSLQTRKNYELNLKFSYAEISSKYNQNTNRNLKKAQSNELTINNNIALDKILEYNYEMLKNITPISKNDIDNFKQLIEHFAHQKQIHKIGVYDNNGVLLSSACFIIWQNRAYYILVGNSSKKENTGSSHLLMDSFIQQNCNQNLVLDFEGSDILGIANFYSGFGAEPKNYYLYQKKVRL